MVTAAALEAELVKAGLPPKAITFRASVWRHIYSIRPATAVRKFRALLDAFPSPAERDLVVKALSKRPQLLGLKPETVCQKVEAIADLLLPPPPPVGVGAGGGRQARVLRALQLVAAAPQLLDVRSSTLASKLVALQGLTGRDAAYVRAVVLLKQRLALMAPATVSAKLRLLQAAAATNDRWAAELRDAQPSRLAWLLMPKLDRLRRLLFVDQRGAALRRSMSSLVRDSEAQFRERYPDYPGDGRY
ncbi:hypothetical protein HXX76_010772 [Chlamydomonas incerta]|uniref:Uncharacterized protein n=1 Tax=Chlamydomonas incerta TaxID=51695 RepID=A0A835VUA2_CHLIN|nr:hypothetical protein HXX76_010772 [Chlamydomonas incerta]|eukprot:KAG2429537.1 hypothetical protein HXX76_010772 [Chlamydomonas incerta]